MVKRGSKPEQSAKRRAVVKGAIAGRAAGAIAKDAGCTERRVRRLLADPETQFLIGEVMRPHRDKLRLMAKRGLRR